MFSAVNVVLIQSLDRISLALDLSNVAQKPDNVVLTLISVALVVNPASTESTLSARTVALTRAVLASHLTV